MDLKFYLNKLAKVDNIESYTLKSLFELKETYQKFLETSEGVDPDFFMTSLSKLLKEIGNGKGKKTEQLIKKSKSKEEMLLNSEERGEEAEKPALRKVDLADLL